jgi:hypothetical protein
VVSSLHFSRITFCDIFVYLFRARYTFSSHRLWLLSWPTLRPWIWRQTGRSYKALVNFCWSTGRRIPGDNSCVSTAKTTRWSFFMLKEFMYKVTNVLKGLTFEVADHSGRVVCGMKYLRPLKHSDRGFESHSKHAWPFAFLPSFVLACVGSGLATGLIPRPRSPTDCKNHSSRLNLHSYLPSPDWRHMSSTLPSRLKVMRVDSTFVCSAPSWPNIRQPPRLPKILLCFLQGFSTSYPRVEFGTHTFHLVYSTFAPSLGV